jgi:phosphocarrier protein
MVNVEEKEYLATVTVANVYGLHARPAAEFVKLANQFESEILVSKDGMEVNGKSIMGVMMLAAEKGSAIEIKARGPDAEAAVKALVKLVAGGFGED